MLPERNCIISRLQLEGNTDSQNADIQIASKPIDILQEMTQPPGRKGQQTWTQMQFAIMLSEGSEAGGDTFPSRRVDVTLIMLTCEYLSKHSHST